jgi:hypothetical protein
LRNHRLALLSVIVQVRVLRTEPELCRSILRAAVDEAGVEGDGEGVLWVLETEVGVDLLALVGGDQSVCADEMDLGLGAEDVGDDAGAVLVCVDFGEEPFYRQTVNLC